jgi:hypothetical protein
MPYLLCISGAIVIPVEFGDISPATNGLPNLSVVIQQGRQDGRLLATPGKFYQPEITSNLVNTLRTGGSSARVVISEKAEEAQLQHFIRFQNDLSAGKLVCHSTL